MSQTYKTEEEQVEFTIKQRNWIRVYLETGNATEAAIQIYNCKNRSSAAQIGYENLRKLDYSELLEEAGISDSKLLQALKEGLEATKVVSAKVTSKDAGINTDDFIEVPDYPSRHRYLETGLKLKRRLFDKKDMVSEEKGPYLIFDLPTCKTPNS